MTPNAEATTLTLLTEVALFLVLLAAMEVTYLLTRDRAKPPPPSRPAAAVSGVVFSLLGLVLAFTYSNAGTRLEEHRRLVVEEVNAIRNVWARFDVMPQPQTEPLRELLRDYVDERIATAEVFPDMEAFELHRGRAEVLYGQLWTEMVHTVDEQGLDEVLLLPPVLELPNVADDRTLVVRSHVMSPAFGLVFVLSILAAALVGGTTSAGEPRHWPYRLLFATVVSGAIHVAVDMEYPRTGIVLTREADDLLLELRKEMDQT